jgi:hypothetical protein
MSRNAHSAACAAEAATTAQHWYMQPIPHRWTCTQSLTQAQQQPLMPCCNATSQNTKQTSANNAQHDTHAVQARTCMPTPLGRLLAQPVLQRSLRGRLACSHSSCVETRFICCCLTAAARHTTPGAYTAHILCIPHSRARLTLWACLHCSTQPRINHLSQGAHCNPVPPDHVLAKCHALVTIPCSPAPPCSHHLLPALAAASAAVEATHAAWLLCSTLHRAWLATRCLLDGPAHVAASHALCSVLHA